MQDISSKFNWFQKYRWLQILRETQNRTAPPEVKAFATSMWEDQRALDAYTACLRTLHDQEMKDWRAESRSGLTALPDAVMTSALKWQIEMSIYAILYSAIIGLDLVGAYLVNGGAFLIVLPFLLLGLFPFLKRDNWR